MDGKRGRGVNVFHSNPNILAQSWKALFKIKTVTLRKGFYIGKMVGCQKLPVA